MDKLKKQYQRGIISEQEMFVEAVRLLAAMSRGCECGACTAIRELMSPPPPKKFCASCGPVFSDVDTCPGCGTKLGEYESTV